MAQKRLAESANLLKINHSTKFLNVPIDDGMVSDYLFLLKSKVSKFLNVLMDVGMVPESLLLFKSRVPINVKDPREVGMVLDNT